MIIILLIHSDKSRYLYAHIYARYTYWSESILPSLISFFFVCLFYLRLKFGSRTDA